MSSLCRMREGAPTMDAEELTVRRAQDTDADGAAAGRLLHDFNREFGDATPGPEAVGARVRELLRDGDTVVLLAGAGPDGIAVLRFRGAIFSAGLEGYLAELYGVPARRGRGVGRALMTAVLEVARAEGADRMDLTTSEADVAARALYERFGFVDREQGPEGPLVHAYELELS